MQLSKEWECFRDNCYIQHHLSLGRSATVLLYQCKMEGMWHKIWVLQVAKRVGWDLAEQHGTDCGPQVRRDNRVQQRPCLSQFSKKEKVCSERTAWLVFIPTFPSLTQTQNCKCLNQSHKRNLCFQQKLFFPFSPRPIPSTFPPFLWGNHHLVTLKAVARHKCWVEFNII